MKTNMGTLYTDGDYLANSQTWHLEDSPWKADQIRLFLQRHRVHPRAVADLGCGVGGVISELANFSEFAESTFVGYDISPQAISLAKRRERSNVRYVLGSAFEGQAHYDLALIVDVIEHVSDVFGFIRECQGLAEYKLFHIPLDLHVSSMLRDSFMEGRYSLGHIHYFTESSALATLRDSGLEIVAHDFTPGSFGLFAQHPSLKKATANVPRWLTAQFSTSLAARLFGGYSLLVLAK